MYSFPFKDDQRIVEFGGGENALFHPNVDIRPGFGVEVVADLNQRLPLEDNKWDGAFSRYQIEHISWRKVRGFISEVYRILAPGASAVFITANLLEQAKILTELPAFEDRWICMVFGDQNYEGDDWTANAHFCGFSPEFAGRLFKEAGFETVTILPLPVWRGDMIIEAKKGHKDRKLIFDKTYFHGGKYENYRDYPSNWIIFDKIMKENPESVLELGCAKGFLLKRFEDHGIRTQGLEISHHCQLSKIVYKIAEFDICKTPWPVFDFDFCFSNCVLEHIPEDNITSVLQEISIRSKRGLHVIDPNDNRQSIEWWQNRMPDNHSIMLKDELEQIENPMHHYVPAGDGKLKVNLGCFTTMFHYGWINIDILPLADFAKDNWYKFHQADIRNGLPFLDNTVDLIYSSHTLEHLTREEGKKVLIECMRIMKPGAVMRVILPDAELLNNKYRDKTLGDLDEINDGCELAKSQSDKLWSVLFEGHRTAYDWDAIADLANEVGFKIERKNFREGHEQILKETLDMMPCISLYVELTRP